MFEKLPDRFWDKVQFEPNTDCWLWDAALNGGYGMYWTGDKQVRAHRLSYESLIGPIPEGFQIDHLCRVRNCVNPWHLEPVTPAENHRRGRCAEVAGERQRLKTHCPRGHAYTEENTYYKPQGWRECRVCRSDRQKSTS
jgi:hypothetical protein